MRKINTSSFNQHGSLSGEKREQLGGSEETDDLK